MPTKFRQVAIDRVTSPDHLDQLLTVTRPQGWIALGSAALLLGAAVLWSLYGSLPREVPGSGLLLHHGSHLEAVFREVPSPTTGLMIERLVETGATVEKGQVLARLLPAEQARLAQEQTAVQHELAGLESSRQLQEGFDAKELALQTQTLTLEETELRSVLERERRDLASLTDRRDRLQKLVDEGVLARDTVLQAQTDLDSQREHIAELEVRARGIPLQLEKLRHEQEQRRQDLDHQIQSARDRLAQLEAQLADAREVRTPFGGRVLRWNVGAGDAVTEGRPLVVIDGSDLTRDAGLDAVMYVSSYEGNRILPGMPVQVSPSTVQREEHGFILGEVIDVAPYPATSRSMLSELEDEELVDEILSQVEVPMRVWVRLRKDSATPSGFDWSAGEGPRTRITPGTPAFGRVVVEDRRPIELVVPAMKKLLGFD